MVFEVFIMGLFILNLIIGCIVYILYMLLEIILWWFCFIILYKDILLSKNVYLVLKYLSNI